MFNKSYCILLYSVFFYWCIAGSAWSEKNSEVEFAIKIPDKLNWVLFPFRKNTRVRMTLCLAAGYIEISNIVVYGLAFLKKGNLNWENINGVWGMLFIAVSLVGVTVELIRDFIYTGREKNILYKLLNGLFCVFLLIVTIGWMAFVVYGLIYVCFKY